MSLTHLQRWLGSDEAAQRAAELRLVAELLTGARRLEDLSPAKHAEARLAAERHGVLGLLPGKTLHWLAAARVLATRSLRALRFTRRAVEAVESAGIVCVVLKGVAAGARWAEPSARQQSDLDLLVARGDLPAASKALIDAGLAQPAFLPGEHVHNASLKPKERSGLLIELHHSLNSNHELKADVSELLARRVQLQTPQGTVPAFALEDDAAYLAMHAATHVMARLAWLVDLQAVGQAGVDWVEAARRARLWNMALPVECAWRQARELLGVPIPERAFSELGTSRAQRTAVFALYAASWSTAGVSRTWVERVFRLALVPPGNWLQLARHRYLAIREQDIAYNRWWLGNR